MKSYKPYIMLVSSGLFLVVSLISITSKTGLWWLWPILFILSIISTVVLFKNNNRKHTNYL